MSERAGRTALVSGASRGIGLEVARALAADGMRVAMVARSADELRARASEIGGRAIPIPCDVADADAVGALVQRAAREFGGAPDVIVNNAGNFALATIEATEPEAFRAAIDVNLVAPFVLAHAFLGEMRQRPDIASGVPAADLAARRDHHDAERGIVGRKAVRDHGGVARFEDPQRQLLAGQHRPLERKHRRDRHG